MHDDNHEQVKAFFQDFRSAWDDGDARAFASLFTEDATYVTWLGDPLIGRDAIEQVHDDVFQRWGPGTLMAVKTIQVRALEPTICSVVTVGGTGLERPIAYDKLQTFTLVWREDRWLCAAFQNTVMSDQAKATYGRAT